MLPLTVEKLYAVPGWKDADGSAWYKYLSALHFKGEYGWAVGSGQILHSNDGGLSWTNTIPPQIDHSVGTPERVFTLNRQSVWVLLLAPRAANNCYYSTNAGQEWFGERLPYMNRPRDVFFVDDTVGWIVSDDGEIPAGEATIHITHDGGRNWEVHPLEIKGSAKRLKFINLRTGLLIQHTTNQDRTRTICNVLVSSDGGYTWHLLKSFNRLITDFCTVSESQFFVVGEGGFISRTTDGGTSWRQTYTRTQETFNAIEVNSHGLGVAGGDFGLLMITDDFGKQWTRHQSEERIDSIVDVSFAGDDRVLLATTSGVLSISF